MFTSVRWFLFSVLPAIGHSVFVITKDECSDRVLECISTASTTPVCGSDGRSYSSLCDVVSKQCQGDVVFVNHAGPCLDESPCFAAQRRSLPALKPRCHSDGTFAAIQCHAESNYCWCVTSTGERIPNTLTRYSKPRCPKPEAARLLPSTSPVSVFKRQPGALPIWKRRWHCGLRRRLQFNANLIATFELEYNRAKNSPDPPDVEKVLAWKFSYLDTDKDGQLGPEEYEELIRLAKMVVKPEACARTLAKVCDADGDLRISSSEWLICLTNPAQNVVTTTGVPLRDEPDLQETTEEPSSDDCPSKRRAALNYQQKTAQLNFFVPACTPDGRYQAVQCYAGYCWCVHADTGVSIPRTSSKDGRPNCHPATMKGCPRHKHQQLLDDMMGVMMGKLETSAFNGSDSLASIQERAATQMFKVLDLNRNQVLQRGKEWKSIRTMVRNRCGKKLPKFCDVDGDFRISLAEWLDCLNIRRKFDTAAKPKGINPVAVLSGA